MSGYSLQHPPVVRLGTALGGYCCRSSDQLQSVEIEPTAVMQGVAPDKHADRLAPPNRSPNNKPNGCDPRAEIAVHGLWSRLVGPAERSPWAFEVHTNFGQSPHPDWSPLGMDPMGVRSV